ncbi:MAG: hypothetical protein SF162_13490 [bacterium]|nr:hypothetical protein [bacterium]
MNTSAVTRRHLILAVLVMILAIIACDCTRGQSYSCSNAVFQIENYYGVDFGNAEIAECTAFVTEACPEAIDTPEAQAAEHACDLAAIEAWKRGQPAPAADYPVAGVPNLEQAVQNPAQQSIVAPPTAAAPESAIPVNCDAFRLTSPLDGLPNGIATFYWDTLPGAPYIFGTIMDENRSVLWSGSFGQANQASLDVSQGAIGGGYALIVRVEARNANNTPLCADEHLIVRAAPNNTASQNSAPPPAVVPTATLPVPK